MSESPGLTLGIIFRCWNLSEDSSTSSFQTSEYLKKNHEGHPRRGAEKRKFLIELCVGLPQQQKTKKEKEKGVVCPDMTHGFRTHMLDHNYGSRSAQWQSEKHGMRKTLERRLSQLHRTLQEKLTRSNEHDNICFSPSLSHLKIWLKGYYAPRTTAVMW